MKRITRREFIGAAALGGLGALGLPLAGCGGNDAPKAKAKVVIIGGGYGGATCAKYLRRLDPAIHVTLVEPNATYHSCPFSNTVIAGFREPATLDFGYNALKGRNVQVVHDRAEAVDPDKRKLRLAGGAALDYDRLVMSPGIDFRFDALEGYDLTALELMPHAWKAGDQTGLLRRQLTAMEDGGLFVMSVPPGPYRCPPGPYERASLVAWYLKQHKPRSKVLILDANENMSKQPLFLEAWEALYPGMIERIKLSDGGRVMRVEPMTRTLHTELDEYRANVANVIPPHVAADIARETGLADDTGWCPVDPMSFESTRVPGIHVIGDAFFSDPLPKSASAANSEAKNTALALAALLNDRSPGEPSLHNTCYSLVEPDYGITISAVYRLAEGKFQVVDGSGGISPTGAGAEVREKEARYAEGWYAAVTTEAFA